MKRILMALSACLVLSAVVRAEDAQLERAKIEILVEQAGELFAEASRPGSVTHTPACVYYFGLMYGSGTNLLARKSSTATSRLIRQYTSLIEKNYDAYTKIEEKKDMAAATGWGRGKIGGRHRVKRLANADKLRDEELSKAIKQWENFVRQLKQTR